MLCPTFRLHMYFAKSMMQVDGDPAFRPLNMVHFHLRNPTLEQSHDCMTVLT
jgi:hypothetical protein